MVNDFQPPPKHWSMLAQLGGVVTAVLMIVGLQAWDQQLAGKTSNSSVARDPVPPELPPIAIARLDSQSLSEPSNAKIETVIVDLGKPIATQRGLTPGELAIARRAWKYFQNNWNAQTGLVNAVDGTPVTTMAGVASTLAALVSARELLLVSEVEFAAKLEQTLKTLAALPLYQNELPNEGYNTTTAQPIALNQPDQPQETGWSAIDLGRLARWLKLVALRYPQWEPQVEAVWKSWRVDRLTNNGQLYAATLSQDQEQYRQQGRLGYESYAAYGFKLWGLPVQQALNVQKHVAFINLYGQSIPYDTRKTDSSNRNWVLSEPYILDGIETGFRALPKAYADRILAAQIARYRSTHQLTALAADHLDRAPFFLHNTLLSNRQPWAVLANRQSYNDFRFLSAKAAIGWHVLYRTDYTQSLVQVVTAQLPSDRGWYSGFYETLRQPNRALTADTNALILESLLYQNAGQPLLTWAGMRPAEKLQLPR